jgi:hypothetical protein
MIVPSNATTKLEYDFLEDLKRTKANISLFELMKLPQIQENFIKTLQGKTAKNSKEINVGVKKGTTKSSPYDDTHTPKSQVVVNASLSGKRSRSTTPPFMVTFEIFNRNVHNCMMDFGASSNVIPFKVCEKLNVKPEQSDIQIIQLDRTKVKVIGELKNILIRMSSNPKIHQTIDIIVVDILDTYGMLLRKIGLLHLKGIFP